MPERPENLSGIFIRTDAQGSMRIFEACKEAGFEESGDGVGKLLLALIDGDKPKKDPLQGIVNHFEKHPEHAALLVEGGSTLAKLGKGLFMAQVKKHWPKKNPPV